MQEPVEREREREREREHETQKARGKLSNEKKQWGREGEREREREREINKVRKTDGGRRSCLEHYKYACIYPIILRQKVNL